MSKLTIDDYKKALEKIKASPKDRIGILGEMGIIGIGVAGGLAGASVVATTVGVTTILGSSALGGLLGGVFVTSTPLGWIIGTAIFGGLAAYGISRLFKSGSVSNERTEQNINKLKKAIEELEKEAEKTIDIDEKYAKLASMYLKLIEANLVDENTVKDVLEGIKSGDINIDKAFEKVKDMLLTIDKS